MADCLTECRTECQTDRLADWLAVRLSGLPFYHFKPCLIDPAGLHFQLLRQSMGILGLPILPCAPISTRQSMSMMAPHFSHSTHFRSPMQSMGLLLPFFTNFIALACLYCQLARRPTNVLVIHLAYTDY